jgi:hypothetical protein
MAARQHRHELNTALIYSIWTPRFALLRSGHPHHLAGRLSDSIGGAANPT